jgi:hypothetical protein
LVVADSERVGELVAALSEIQQVEILVSSGGDDTIDLFEARRAMVVVLTASLQVGDTKSLIVTLRAMVPRGEVAIVVIGDDAGPIRTALDALELAPDRFVTRPLSPKALRFAVYGGIDAVRIVRGLGPLPPAPRPVATGTAPGKTDPAPVTSPASPPVSAARRPPSVFSVPSVPPRGPATAAVLPPVTAPPGAAAAPSASVAGPPAAAAATPPASAAAAPAVAPVVAEPAVPVALEDDPTAATRAALRARWEALADSIVDIADDDELEDLPERGKPAAAAPADPAAAVVPAASGAEPAGSSPPMVIKPRRRPEDLPIDEVASPTAWKPETPDELAPIREPTLILRDPGPAPAPAAAPEPAPAMARPAPARESGIGARPDGDSGIGDAPDVRQPGPTAAVPEARDFARELRAKMSMMAQRLFQGGDAPAPGPADHAPRHDHHTEIDLASLGDEPPLGGGAELEGRAAPRHELRESMTSPGSWDSQVRERGLPDSGAITRGGADAATLLAKMFAQGATGRVGFRRDDVETIVYFDHGRPVFASSNEPRDRMGELLLREGKITASQYERCQAVVAESGRRMGEILVDLGYLKRRELLPAVRRHVEDIVYSLFGWERGTYYIVLEPQPSAERIRLSRHPAALILEGIRRKLDRTSLERMIGSTSTVIEVRDRERLGGIVNMGDLAAEERSALAAFDGQADLAQVARSAGVDLADVLPLAWGLCVLGLATARRSDAEAPDEGSALVGETDLAIDRARVRARWQLVTDADYFALLGVRRDATGFEIRRAYQSARRDFAADCFPTDLRRELARELDDIAHVLDEAFRVLRDDRLRQTYLAHLIDA